MSESRTNGTWLKSGFEKSTVAVIFTLALALVCFRWVQETPGKKLENLLQNGQALSLNVWKATAYKCDAQRSDLRDCRRLNESPAEIDFSDAKSTHNFLRRTQPNRVIAEYILSPLEKRWLYQKDNPQKKKGVIDLFFLRNIQGNVFWLKGAEIPKEKLAISCENLNGGILALDSDTSFGQAHYIEFDRIFSTGNSGKSHLIAGELITCPKLTLDFVIEDASFPFGPAYLPPLLVEPASSHLIFALPGIQQGMAWILSCVVVIFGVISVYMSTLLRSRMAFVFLSVFFVCFALRGITANDINAKSTETSLLLVLFLIGLAGQVIFLPLVTTEMLWPILSRQTFLRSIKIALSLLSLSTVALGCLWLSDEMTLRLIALNAPAWARIATGVSFAVTIVILGISIHKFRRNNPRGTAPLERVFGHTPDWKYFGIKSSLLGLFIAISFYFGMKELTSVATIGIRSLEFLEEGIVPALFVCLFLRQKQGKEEFERYANTRMEREAELQKEISNLAQELEKNEFDYFIKGYLQELVFKIGLLGVGFLRKHYDIITSQNYDLVVPTVSLRANEEHIFLRRKGLGKIEDEQITRTSIVDSHMNCDEFIKSQLDNLQFCGNRFIFPFKFGEDLNGAIVFYEVPLISLNPEIMDDLRKLSTSFAQVFQLVRKTYSTCRVTPIEILQQMGISNIANVNYNRATTISQAVTVFLDVRNFTWLTERIGDVRISLILRDLFDKIGEFFRKQGGTVECFKADMLIAHFFPGRLSKDQLADKAINCCLMAIQELPDIRAYMMEKHEIQGFDIGIGLAAGSLDFVMIGSSERFQPTTISSLANKTSRIQDQCSYFGATFLLDKAAAENNSVLSWPETRTLGRFAPKGFEQSPFEIIEIFKHDVPEIADFKRSTKGKLEEAIKAYSDNELEKAAALFEEIRFPKEEIRVIKSNGESGLFSDAVVEHYLRRIAHRQKHPEEKWPGFDHLRK